MPKENVFSYVSNQEMNRSLKLVGEICDIKCKPTFHSARYTFVTTVTPLCLRSTIHAAISFSISSFFMSC